MKELTLPDNTSRATVDGRPAALAEGKVDGSRKRVTGLSDARAVS